MSNKNNESSSDEDNNGPAKRTAKTVYDVQRKHLEKLMSHPVDFNA